MKKIYSFLLLGLLLSIGNAWADTTYKLTQVSSVVAGGLYVFEQDGHVMNNTISNNALQTTTSYNLTGLLGTESYVWTLEATTNGFYLKNVSLGDNSPYLKNASSTGVSLAADGSVWTFSFDNGVALIQNKSNGDRFLGYTNATSYAYKAYAVSNLASYSHAITVYQLEEEDATEPSLTVSPLAIAFGDVMQNEAVNAKTLTVSFSNLTGAITYSALTAPFNATGTITHSGDAITIAVSTATIGEFSQTLTIQSTADNKSVDVVVSINVLDPNGPGTENNPYTVAQARAAIDAGEGISNVFATGIVSSIVTAYNSTYGNISFNFVDDAGDETFLQAYRCGGAEAANVVVGDIVVVSGNLTKYQSTYEFAQGCQIVSLQHPVVTTPSIDLSSTSIEAPSAGIEDGEITVTYNNITTVVAELIFCDAQGIAVQEGYDWLSAGLNEINNIMYEVDANEGEARTAYMKISALTDNSDIIYSDLITISQAAYVAPGHGDSADDPFSVTEVLSGTATGSDVYVEGYIVGYVIGSTSFTSDMSNTQVKNTNWALAASADETEFANTIPIQITQSFQAQYGLLNHPYLVGAKMIVKGDITAYFGKSGVKNPDEITLVSATLTLGQNGWSTFSADYQFAVSGADVYMAAPDVYEQATKVILTKVPNGIVPAEKGVILKGEEGATVTITPTNEAASDFDEEANELMGTAVAVAETQGDTYMYVLATIEGVTAFYPCGVNIPMNKAWMYIFPASTQAPVRIVFAEDNATNLESLMGSENVQKFFENGQVRILREGVVYDATGRVVR